MITKEELKRIGQTKGLTNVGHAEKDYLLDLFLLAISRETKNELVFKGGTCLYKFHGLPRFSEDLDFSAVGNPKLELLAKRVIARLADFGVKAQLKEKKEPYNSVLWTFLCEGPLYTGEPRTRCSIRVDVNTKSEVILEPENKMYSSNYPDLPPFTILAMNVEEILAEKARAIITRNKARDAYDAGFLLQRNTRWNEQLIRKKLRYYSLQWNPKRFARKLKSLKTIWEKDLKHLVTLTPLLPFNEAISPILKAAAGKA